MDLLQFLSNDDSLPKAIGSYEISKNHFLDDGAFQIQYISETGGHFTITFYEIPEDYMQLDYENVISEAILDSIGGIFEMERIGRYRNVELIGDGEICPLESADYKFKVVEFNYYQIYEDKTEGPKEISYLFLKTEQGLFHKIRYNNDILKGAEGNGESLDFLEKWSMFILGANLTKNIN